jgi:2-oxoglutarate ferredoxin oxidoreductase subunit gamma
MAVRPIAADKERDMEERILIAGAGGQGALTIGKFLATVTMDEHHVTFFPSYGAEVRGGTAHCHVVISDREIATPVVDRATTLIIMNQMSWGRFSGQVAAEGLLLVNGSMVRPEPAPPCGRLASVPASELAAEMGDIRVANVILLGAFNAIRHLVPDQRILDAMQRIFGGDPTKAGTLDLNRQAYQVGLAQAAKAG